MPVFITGRKPLFLMETPEDGGAGGQAPAVETPETAAQEAAQQQAEIDWAKRYSDLQPEYTRATQEAAELRRERELYQALLYAEDEDTRRQAADALGIQIDEETDDDTQDLDPRVAARLEAMEQRFERQQTEAQQQAQIAQMETYAEQQMDQLGLPQEDAVRDWIVSRAVALPPTPEGMPDIKAAHTEFQALIDAQKKQWAGTKRTHQISAVGQAGTNAPDLTEMSTNQLTEWMVDRARSMEQQ